MLSRTRARSGRGWGEKGGGGGVLTWTSGYNFPLFLVYPVDMPAVTSVPNRNVNWSRGGSSSQWFGTYIQLNFTH